MIRPFSTRAVIAAGLLATSLNSVAATPADAELEACVARAEHGLAMRESSLQLMGVNVFRLSNDRRMITLDARIGDGATAMRPRIYCTIDSDGVVSALQTMPRLPLQPIVQQVVAK